MSLDALNSVIVVVQVMIAGKGLIHPLVTTDIPLYNVNW